MSNKNNQFSETDTSHKIIVPYLENLGFKKSEMEFEFPIKAQIGSGKAKTVFADIVIKQKDRAVMIVEIKKTDHRLEERDREQAISYARLFDPEPVNFAVVTNGRIWQAYNVKTKERIPKVPSKDTLFKDIAKFKLTDDQREEANYFAVEGYKTVQDIENALRKCHDTLYANDGLTPLQTFEEINKFLFSKIQEERRVKKNGDQNRFTTKYLKTRKPKVEMQRIFEDAINDFPDDVEKIFFKGDEIEVCNESILQVVKVLENKGFTETDIDIVGMAYETFLKPVFRNKHLGQYFTPREIVNFMVEFLKPKIGDLVIDPAFGSGGFLVEVFQTLKEKIAGSDLQDKTKKEYKKKLCSEWIFGTEIAPHLAKACKINMYIHGDGKTGVYKHDGLVDCGGIEENKFNLVLTNPPFGGVINKKDLLENFELGKDRARQLKEVLFLERCIRLAKSGGKIGIILPDGILTNSSLQYVRDFILQECKILGIVSLPNHAFSASGAGVKASIMFLEKKEKGRDHSNYDIFMAEAEHVGYDATGRPDDNEFGDILDKYYEFKVKKGGASEKIFFLKNSEIEGRLDIRFYSPEFLDLENKVRSISSKTIGDFVLSMAGGETPKTSEAIKYYTDKENGIPFLRVQNLSPRGVLKLEDCKYITLNVHQNSLKRSQVKGGDLLVKITGVGRMAVAVVAPNEFEGNINQHIVVIKTKNKETSEILADFLNTNLGEKLASRRSTGGTRPALDYESLKSIPVIFDKRLTEKTRKYRKNISDCEDKIQRLKKKSEKFLEESLGFKIEKEENEQSFELNIQNFGEARFDPNYYQREYRNAEEVLKNSKYPLQKIGELVYIKKGIEIGSQKYVKQGIPFIRVADINEQGINFETDKRISEENFIKFKDYQPQKGDLLFSKDGTIGICILVKNSIPSIISGGILRLLPKEGLNGDFLRALIHSNPIQAILKRESTGAVIKHLLIDKFKNIEIPLPPLNEQNRISKQIEKYESEIANLKNEVGQEKGKQDKVLDVLF